MIQDRDDETRSLPLPVLSSSLKLRHYRPLPESAYHHWQSLRAHRTGGADGDHKIMCRELSKQDACAPSRLQKVLPGRWCYIRFYVREFGASEDRAAHP